MSLFDSPFEPQREAALVTGAGNGIGRAIAQALVGEGVRTIFADLDEDRVRAAVASSARPELAVPWIGDLAAREHSRRACAPTFHSTLPARGRVAHASRQQPAPGTRLALPRLDQPS